MNLVLRPAGPAGVPGRSMPPARAAGARPGAAPPGTATPAWITADAPPDRIAAAPAPDRLAAYRQHAASTRGPHAGAVSGDGAHDGVRLETTRAAAAAIAAGEHQVRTVDGRRLTYPSQNLGMIESRRPDDPGQTHALERHVGTTLADNVARLTASPLLHAAGSYTSAADAQYATDETIANPANQRAIGAFLADPGRLKTVLERVGLGRTVGTTTLRSDVLAGRPSLIAGTTATVVLVKDPGFPEGYRVLTTYPDTRRPEADAQGNRLP